MLPDPILQHCTLNNPVFIESQEQCESVFHMNQLSEIAGKKAFFTGKWSIFLRSCMNCCYCTFILNKNKNKWWTTCLVWWFSNFYNWQSWWVWRIYRKSVIAYYNDPNRVATHTHSKRIYILASHHVGLVWWKLRSCWVLVDSLFHVCQFWCLQLHLLCFTAKLQRYPPRALTRVISRLTTIKHAADLASKLLQLRPEKRITAVEALRHSYFADLPEAVHLLKPSKLAYPVYFGCLLSSCDTKC